jgi:hypothetical protein
MDAMDATTTEVMDINTMEGIVIATMTIEARINEEDLSTTQHRPQAQWYSHGK